MCYWLVILSVCVIDWLYSVYVLLIGYTQPVNNTYTEYNQSITHTSSGINDIQPRLEIKMIYKSRSNLISTNYKIRDDIQVATHHIDNKQHRRPNWYLIYYQYKHAKTFLTFIISRRSTNLMPMAPAVMEPWDMLMSEVKCHAQLWSVVIQDTGCNPSHR
jgi:hypothetical protein